MLRFPALVFATVLLSTSAQAAMVAGWEVSEKPDDKDLCTIQHNYEDKEDDNAKNAVHIVFGKDKGAPGIGIILAYAKWDLTLDEVSKADVLIDDALWQRDVAWKSVDKQVLATFVDKPDALIQQISTGKTMVLRFDGKKGDEAEFELLNAGQAIGAVQSCIRQQK